MTVYRWLLAGALALLVAALGFSLAIAQGRVEVDWCLLGTSGGGAGQGGTTALQGSVGQGAVGGGATSGLRVEAGFWPGVAASSRQVFLPLALRTS